ncbi:hypothetical protein [Nocardia sp. NBC_00511]|uniref:hypothetical protein n=1 Tax=Nocardia sp. NBC_00511 TaxID=2903591 RepID=UPI0030DE9FD1
MTYYNGTPETSKIPPTILDGVGWPGFALLFAGVVALACTAGSPGADAGTVAGVSIAVIALLSGVLRITIEHGRFRRQEETGV